MVLSSQQRVLFLASAILASSGVSGFGIHSPLQKPPAFVSKTSRSTICTRSSKLFAIRCEGKYYQLEEMEDKENSTTELFLKEDGTVLIGETDGPLWEEATGYWQVRPGTDDFSMTIVKKFTTGSEGRDMGEFAFEVTRTFDGDMTHVGESVAITGVMKNSDDGGEVGFFNMIDGTDDRQDKRSDARPGIDKLATDKEDKSDAAATHKGMTVPLGMPTVSLQQQQQLQQQTLPAGWEEHFDPTQQRYFYVDTTTGVSQWERPDGAGAFQQQQPTYGGGGDAGYSYGGYQQQQDAYSYGGQATAFQPQTAAAQPQTTTSDLPPGWEEHFDAGQQAYYYVDTSTGVSQWEKPVLQQAQLMQQPSALPAGWEEHFDPGQQRNYYVNTLTGTSQWERPQ